MSQTIINLLVRVKLKYRIKVSIRSIHFVVIPRLVEAINRESIFSLDISRSLLF